MKKKVFITRRLPGTAISKLDGICEVDVWDEEIPPTRDDIIDRASNCSGLVTLLSDDINGELIESLPNLEIIAQYAVGYNNIDIDTASAKGIIVTNTPGVLTETTADLSWALILSCARRIVESDSYVRKGMWKVAWGPEMLLGVDIFNATLGIIGMGRIGYAVAKRATGFDMKILYHSRSSNDITHSAEVNLGAKRVDLDTLLTESDIISIHVPLTEETDGMIGKNELSRMKPTAILINTSRGRVVIERDLIEALRERRIRSAGLDVFEIEPVQRANELLELENVVLLPHIGSATIATRTRMADIAIENLVAGLNGQRPPNIVNADVLM
ncbi:MAG: 2-hydroxyacid dehydrogenase [Candidatus Thorarchaeota archaeon]